MKKITVYGTNINGSFNLNAIGTSDGSNENTLNTLYQVLRAQYRESDSFIWDESSWDNTKWN